MKKFMINCNEATRLVSLKEEQKLEKADRFRLWMHLSICRLCKAYEQQIQFITRKFERMQVNVKLPERVKDRIKKAIS